MAAVATLTDVVVRIKFDTGAVKNGKAVLTSRSYSKIKMDATDDQLLDFADGINALIDLGDLDSVAKVETRTLARGA